MTDKTKDDLAAALGPLMKVPPHGIYGGPLCCLKAIYEDGTDENSSRHKGYIAPSEWERAREALAKYEAQKAKEPSDLVQRLREFSNRSIPDKEAYGQILAEHAADRIEALKAAMPVLQASAPVAVTDEMMERAKDAFIKKRPNHAFWEEDEAALRAAIKAASVQPFAVTDEMVQRMNDWSREKYGRPVGANDCREALEAALAQQEEK